MNHYVMLAALIGFVFPMLLLVAFLLLTPAVYDHAKPKTKKRVIELTCDGWLAKKLLANNWGASTIPLAFIVLILYWSKDSSSDFPAPDVRVHEFVHVSQDEANVFFLVSWVKYFAEMIHQFRIYRNWMQAYQNNKYEVAAYAVEDAVLNGTSPMPDWAK